MLWYNVQGAANWNSSHHYVGWYYNRTGDINYWKAIDYAQCYYNPSDTYIP
jgi:hypothetical protein